MRGCVCGWRPQRLDAVALRIGARAVVGAMVGPPPPQKPMRQAPAGAHSCLHGAAQPWRGMRVAKGVEERFVHQGIESGGSEGP